MKIGKYKRIILEPHEEQFIRDNFYSMTNQQLADYLGLKLTKLRGFAYRMGLKRINLEYWTEEQIQFLKDNYKEIGDTELAEIFEVKWFKNKGWTKKHIEKKRRYLKLKRTAEQRKAIHTRNKLMGKLSVANKKRWETSPPAPEGEKRVWYRKDNTPFVVIKTKEGFVHYNPWLWKLYYGEIPKGYVVRNFSNKLLDVTINDLKLISKSHNATLNSTTRLSTESKKTKQLINKLSRAIQKQQENEQENHNIRTAER